MPDMAYDIPSLEAEQQAILKRQAIAQMLMQKGMAPLDMPQTPARGYTPSISPLQGLAQIANAYVGKMQMDQTNQAQKDLASKYEGMRSQDLQNMSDALLGSTKPSPEGSAGFAIQNPPQDIKGQMATALAMKDPQMRQLAMSMIGKVPQLEIQQLQDKIQSNALNSMMPNSDQANSGTPNAPQGLTPFGNSRLAFGGMSALANPTIKSTPAGDLVLETGQVIPNTAPISPEKDKMQYMAIQQKMNLGQPVTPEESAFAKSYEKTVELNTNTRLAGLKDMKAYDVIDKDTGRMVPKVSLSDIQDNPDKYVSPSDPNFKAYNNNTQFETATRRFVGMIAKNADMVAPLEKKYGGNQLATILNTPINKVQNLIGSGDFNSLRLVLSSLKSEVAKVESGSMGIRGVDVNSFLQFGKSLDENMPVGELLKVIDTAKQLGANRISTVMEEKARLKDAMGIQKTPDEEAAIAPAQQNSAPSTSTNLPPLVIH